MRLQLSPGNILVRPNQQVTETEGGILVAKNAQRRQIIGTVIALGPDLTATDGSKISPNVGEQGTERRLKPNDQVFYSSRAGLALEKGEDSIYIFLKFNDIIMSWTDEEERSLNLDDITEELLTLITDIKFV